jgi:hypothetical protein
MMVVEVAILGGDQLGRCWGVMWGGAPAISGAEGGSWRWHARMHVRWWWRRRPFGRGGRRGRPRPG